MKLTVVGSGYVGLVTAACFSFAGHDVLCVEKDKKKISSIKKGNLPFYEPNLENLVKEGIKNGRLIFSTDLSLINEFSESVFICVGTPSNPDGSANISYVRKSLKQILLIDNLKLEDIVIKSTVPPGTADRLSSEICEKRNIDLVSCPEFLREGSAVQDFLKPQRIILGLHNQRKRDKFRSIFSPFNRKQDRILFMDPVSAELTKYASNAMLATKISFINELSRYSDLKGANIEKVRMGMGLDSRIGLEYLYPGCGYGGSCFPKDIDALISSAKESNLNLDLIKAVKKINQSQPDYLIDKLSDHYDNQLNGKTISLWGLSFKPNTDDMRSAPALKVISKLVDLGCFLKIYDPKAMENFKNSPLHTPNTLLCNSASETLEGSDGLVICTEWREFFQIDLNVFQRMKSKVVIDGRNIYPLETMKENDIIYYSIGRPFTNFKQGNVELKAS